MAVGAVHLTAITYPTVKGTCYNQSDSTKASGVTVQAYDVPGGTLIGDLGTTGGLSNSSDLTGAYSILPQAHVAATGGWYCTSPPANNTFWVLYTLKNGDPSWVGPLSWGIGCCTPANTQNISPMLK